MCVLVYTNHVDVTANLGVRARERFAAYVSVFARMDMVGNRSASDFKQGTDQPLSHVFTSLLVLIFGPHCRQFRQFSVL